MPTLKVQVCNKSSKILGFEKIQFYINFVVLKCLEILHIISTYFVG